MKAEVLFEKIKEDNGEYAGIKREEVDYASKREEMINNYLNGVGEISKQINNGLSEIKSRNNISK